MYNVIFVGITPIYLLSYHLFVKCIEGHPSFWVSFFPVSIASHHYMFIIHLKSNAKCNWCHHPATVFIFCLECQSPAVPIMIRLWACFDSSLFAAYVVAIAIWVNATWQLVPASVWWDYDWNISNQICLFKMLLDGRSVFSSLKKLAIRYHQDLFNRSYPKGLQFLCCQSYWKQLSCEDISCIMVTHGSP